MKIIGLTGGIGSGKTIVANIFSFLGIPIYNSDYAAKYLMEHDPTLKSKIIQLLGPEAYTNNQLHRKYIASKVFTNSDLLQALNAIVHPAVFADFKTWCTHQSTDYVIKEAALIIETMDQQNLDALIVVTAPIELRIHRVMQRDKTSREEILTRISKQSSDEEKLSYAQYIIQNDGIQSLIPQIINIHKSILQKEE